MSNSADEEATPSRPRLLIKPAVVAMMARDFKDFVPVPAKGPFYVFRRSSPRELFEYVKFQVDRLDGALAIDVCCTYDDQWDLYPTGAWGHDNGLANIMTRRDCIDVLENWNFYRNDAERLPIVLSKISSNLRTWGIPYLDRARAKLESDAALQEARRLIRAGPVTTPEERRAFLNRLTANDHTLDKLRSDVLEKWTVHLIATATRSRTLRCRLAMMLNKLIRASHAAMEDRTFRQHCQSLAVDVILNDRPKPGFGGPRFASHRES